MRKRIVTSVVALTCATLLVGCGSLGVRVAEESGGPIKVGVSEQKGSAPGPEPTEDPVPEGFRKVTLPGECPFETTMVIPDEYKMNGPIGSMTVFSEGAANPDASVVVTCRNTFDKSLSKARDRYLDYALSEPDSDMLLQNRYEIDEAAAGVFQAKLAQGEAFAMNEDKQMVATIYVGYADGAAWELRIQATSPWGDEPVAKRHQTILDHITVDGQKLKTLKWEDM
ncbi:hypothetical protein QP572_08755 [Brevibacterium sp. UMB10442]|nr:hypothetical protein [Brevibacterium sp. UMB10442]